MSFVRGRYLRARVFSAASVPSSAGAQPGGPVPARVSAVGRVTTFTGSSTCVAFAACDIGHQAHRGGRVVHDFADQPVLRRVRAIGHQAQRGDPVVHDLSTSPFSVAFEHRCSSAARGAGHVLHARVDPQLVCRVQRPRPRGPEQGARRSVPRPPGPSAPSHPPALTWARRSALVHHARVVDHQARDHAFHVLVDPSSFAGPERARRPSGPELGSSIRPRSPRTRRRPSSARPCLSRARRSVLVCRARASLPPSGPDLGSSIRPRSPRTCRRPSSARPWLSRARRSVLVRRARASPPPSG